MAKAGQGTSRSAEKSQSSDVSSVKTAGRGASGPEISVSVPGGGLGFPSGVGGIGGIGSSGGIGGESGGRGAGASTSAGGKPDRGQGPNAGVGPDGAPGIPEGPGSAEKAPGTGGAGSGTAKPDASGGVSGSGGTGSGSGAAADGPPGDIPRDTTGEDQVARQLREAALAETDPAIREALWDEYRKTMGIRKK